MKLVLLPVTLIAAACASTDVPANVADPDNPTQIELDAIADSCDAPLDWLQLDGSQVNFRPITDEEIASGEFDPKFEAAGCVFEMIRKTGITKVGFTGNGKAREIEQ